MVGALIAGGAALAGGWMANRGKRKEAQKDRDFQERMSSTSWQRGKADMEAAGINPALAYAKGGASSPGGAMAGQEDITQGAVSSAMQAKRLKKELEVMEEEKQRIYSDNKLKANQAVESSYRTQLLERQQRLAEVEVEQMRLRTPWLAAQEGAARKWGTQAAFMQLLLQSGGSQAAGLVGGLGLASVVRRTRKLPIGKGR